MDLLTWYQSERDISLRVRISSTLVKVEHLESFLRRTLGASTLLLLAQRAIV